MSYNYHVKLRRVHIIIMLRIQVPHRLTTTWDSTEGASNNFNSTESDTIVNKQIVDENIRLV